jgi:hypothetical protein
MTAAMQTAAWKFLARRSYRVAILRKSLSRPNIRSMALRFLYRYGEKQFFHTRLDLGGMFGAAPWPRFSGARRRCHSPCRRGRDRLWTSDRAARRPLRVRPLGRRSARTRWDDNPYRSAREFWWCVRRVSGQSLGSAPPFSARGAAMRLHRAGVDQQFRGRSAAVARV